MAIDNLITYESLDTIGLALDPPTLNFTGVGDWSRWHSLTGDAAVLSDLMTEAADSRQMLGMSLPQCPIVQRGSNAFGWMWWCFEPVFNCGVLTNPVADLYQPVTGFPNLFVINAPTCGAGYHRCRVLWLLDTLGILPPLYHGVPPEYQL